MRNARAIIPSPKPAFDQYRFSPAVAAGDFIFVSGVVGRGADGKATATPAEEYHAAFKEMQETLAAAGASLADIVALDTFHVSNNLREDLEVFTEVRAQYFDAPHPCLTAICVASLAVPGARVEIRATAYVGVKE